MGRFRVKSFVLKLFRAYGAFKGFRVCRAYRV